MRTNIQWLQKRHLEWLLYAAGNRLEEFKDYSETTDLLIKTNQAVLLLEQELGDEIEKILGFRPMNVWKQ